MHNLRLSKQNFIKATLLILIILVAIFLTLFQHWEITNETWGYWLFARVFAETGKFIVIQRSPPYTIYLNLFRALPYPTSVTAEYIVTTFITIIGIVYIFKSYLGLPLSLLAAIIWLPYMQVSEPPVQKIALVITGIAIYFRQQKENIFKISSSYALFGLASLFRPTYLIFIPLFIIFDLVRIFKKRVANFNQLLKPNLKTDWPVFMVILLYLAFQLFQSPISGNTVYFANAKWFPNNGKSEEILQNYNWAYIWEKYHTFVGQDFYFTNQELFGGAHDSLSAIRFNPKFVLRNMLNNFREAIPMITKMTVISRLYSSFPYVNIFDILLILILFYGAIRGAKHSSMRLFVIGCLIILIVSIIFTPHYRFLIFPIIPLFILASYWYGQQLANIMGKNWFPMITFVFLVLFSPNLTGINYNNRAYLDWMQIGKIIIDDSRKGDLRILDDRSSRYNSSMKETFSAVYPLIQNCKGIMALEHNFIGAFTNIPLQKIYDVWEIPPFGHLGESAYMGLNPDRINCVLVSRELSLYEGFATNYQIRYQNYIKPYVEELLSKGAASYDIPSYGKVVILN